MKRAMLALGLLAVAGVAMAQQVVRLAFPSSSAREVWVAAAPPDAEPKGGIQIEGGSYELKAQNPGANDAVFVWDKASGNLAFKPLKEIQSDWALKPEDFRYILRVDVRVEHAGKPVESASVQFKDGRQDVSRILDSTSKGTLSFWGVKPGAIKIAVTYNSEGKTKGPIKQTFELAAKRDSPVPILVVSIGDKVATVEGGPAPATTGSGGTTKAVGEATTGDATKAKGDRPTVNDTSNPLGGLISFLIAVIVAGLLFWFGLRWMKQNQDKVQRKLEEMGVQVPKAPGDTDGATTIVAPITPAPPEKIILDSADPGTPTAVATMTSGVPRLVGGAGSFDLQEGESVVSREHGEVVIPNESTVSRRHAVLVRNGAEVKLRDEGSTNGTFVNGLKVASEVVLKPGDSVQFGAVAFRFES